MPAAGTCAVAAHPHCRLEREGGLGRFCGRPWGMQPTSEPVCDSTVQGFPTRQSTSLSPLALTLLPAMKPATLSHLAQPVPRGSRSLTEGLGFLHRLVIALSDAQSSFCSLPCGFGAVVRVFFGVALSLCSFLT